jgi:hypothetical protein
MTENQKRKTRNITGKESAGQPSSTYQTNTNHPSFEDNSRSDGVDTHNFDEEQTVDGTK